MSMFFADEDNITFGVQASNVYEVAQFSSTLDDVFVRLFTNNGILTPDNLETGIVIGASNYDKSGANRNNLYFGHLDNASNITRILTMEDTRIGINTDAPTATLHVLSDAGDSNIARFMSSNNTPAIVVDAGGLVGINTEAVAGQNVTIRGSLYADELHITGLTSSSLSNIATLDVRTITATTSDGIVNLSQTTLSNLNQVDTRSLRSTTSDEIINVHQNTLSNIKTASVVNLTSDNSNINVSTRSLSNITTTFTENLNAHSDNINVSTRSLSNITTTFTENINSHADNINVSTRSLSNITTTFTESLSAHGDNINVSTKSLSNITTASVVNLTSDADNINVSTRSLSNITTTFTETISAHGDNINVSAKSLSNITTASVAKLTSDTDNINVSTRSLSNITTTFTEKINSHADNINVSTRSLSNITTTFTESLSAHADNINVSTKSLSNITTASVVNLTSDNLNINVSTRSLSNITTTFTEKISAHGDNINVSFKSLSNISTTYTESAVVGKLTTVRAGGLIDVDQKSLSNLNGLYVNAGSTVYTNSIDAYSGDAITFNGNNLSGISNLTVSGDIKVRGEFFVMETTTCNTNMFRIENDGTGPALVVNQMGSEHITQFQDDSNVVFFIKDGGQAAFGSFGGAIDTGIPSTLVYIENPSASNQTALHVKQENSNQSSVIIEGVDNVVTVNAYGNIGIGTQSAGVPLAIHDTSAILIPVGDTSQRPGDVQGYIRYNTQLASFEGCGANSTWGTLGGVKDVDGNTFIAAENFAGSDDNTLRFITNGGERMRIVDSGNVGIGTSTTPLAKLHVEGETLVRNGRLVNQVLSGPLYSELKSGTDSIVEFGFSNTTSRLHVGVASDATYIMNETNNDLRIGTSNVTRVFVKADGNVGIGTSTPATKLEVAGTVRAPTLEVSTISSLDTIINVSHKTLSNIDFIKADNMEVLNQGIDTLTVNTVTSSASNINVSTRTLSNITTTFTENLNAHGSNINVSAKSLSNITTASIVNLTSDIDNINVSARSLSNITTTFTEKLNSHTDNINVSTRSLSNITTTFTENLNAHGLNINVSTKSLSNISTASIAKLTSDTPTINVSARSLSNITTTFTEQLSAHGDNINVSAKSLSNITTASVVNLTSDADNINVSTRTLSNITTTFTERLSAHSDNIDVSTRSLSNITTTVTENITSHALNINISTRSLSNITTTFTESLSAHGSNINVSAKSLSNIETASVVNLTSDNDNINVSTRSLSNITTTFTENLSAHGLNINVSTRSLSNITTTFTESLSAHGSNINVSAKSLSNITTASVINLTSDADNINVSTRSLSNITTTFTEKLSAHSDNINVSTRSLSNITTTFTENLNAHGLNINVSAKSLSNITTASVAKLTSDTPTINVSTRSLSNITTTFTEKLSAHGDNINVSTKSLSNITTASIVNLTSDTDNINVSARTLSNITTTFTENLNAHGLNINVSTKSLSNLSAVSTERLVSEGSNINVSTRSLSNITSVSVQNLTSDGSNINISTRSLSNISTTFTEALSAHGDNINVSTKSLSNITNVSAATTITNTITTTAPYIDFASTTLSNVFRLHAENFNVSAIESDSIIVSTINTKAAGSNINLSANTLSNITTTFTEKLNAHGDNINVSAKSLSNITTASVVNLTSDTPTINVSTRTLSNITTTFTESLSAHGLNINVSAKSLSNITTASVAKITSDVDNINVSTKSLSNITTASVVNLTSDADNINVSTRSLSNITTVFAEKLNSHSENINVSARTLSNITTTFTENLNAHGLNINVSTKSLSNITTASVAKITSDVANINVSTKSLSNITTASVVNLTSDADNINVSTKSLSNITNVSAENVTLQKLTTTQAAGFIDVDQKSLSNLNDVYVNTGSTVYANSYDTYTGAEINFNGNNLTGISNLTVSGDIKVRGEFFVMDTTTCNTNMFRIENDGTGPALVVNQLGSEHIAQFQDDSNVVFFIKNGGQTAFGNFGHQINSNIPGALVFMENPTDSNQVGLWVKQDNTSSDILRLRGDGCNVVVTHDGKLGMGIDVPTARIHVAQGDSITTELLHFSTVASNNALVVGADGHIGIGTDAHDYYALIANGVIRAENIVVAPYTGAGSVPLVTAYGMTATDGRDYLEFNQMDFSNVDVIFANQVRATNDGTAAAPAYTFSDNTSTGVFQPADNELGLSTNGSERMRVIADGNVGIGTAAPATKLEVAGTVRAPKLEVNYLDTVNASGIIDVSAKTLSNITTTSVANLTSDADNINVSTKSLSNITTASIAKLTSDTPTINVSTRSLSNITTTFTEKLSAHSDNINVSTKSLSNITTTFTEKLSSQSDNINVSTRSLSNITTTFTENLSAHGSNINVSTRSLSNITTASVTNLTSDGSNINVSTKSLSNITTASVVNLTSDADNINVSTKSLSNITTASVANLTSDADNINVSTRSLSNITTTFTEKLSAHADNINVSTKSLSNITTASVVNLTSDADNINVSTRSLSNITTTFTENLNAHGLNINVSTKSLSNISTVSLSKITSDTTNINVSGKTLSNITTLSATNATVTKLTTAQASGFIDVDATSLSNLNGIYVNTGSTVYTNSIDAYTGEVVTFNGNSVTGISNLTVSGDITVRGEFFVMDTTTCNTNQLRIENDGTGPALVVNQIGNEHITQFQDDSNVVFFIKDGGSAAFGSFGTTINTAIPEAQVYIDNVATNAQDALYIEQRLQSKNILTMVGTGVDSAPVVVSAAGKIGMNVATPVARIDVSQTNSNVEFVHYTSPTLSNAFVINGSGEVGLGVAPISGNVITTQGVIDTSTLRVSTVTSYGSNIDFSQKTLSNIYWIQSDFFQTGDLSSSSIVVDSISTSAASCNIDINYKSLSNLNAVNATTIETSYITSLGQVIDFSGKSLSNINKVAAATGVYTSSISTPSITSATDDISFNYKRVLDVDSLVVRSNITVLMVGENTYSNLPTNLVRVEASTGRISDAYLSSNVIRVDGGTGLINESLLPPVETNRKTLLHTKDRVGIGLKNPQQKLHVHGTACITSGRLGIGTTTPLGTFHLQDNNGVSPTFYVEQKGSADIFRVVGSNSTPLLYINANNTVGIHTSSPSGPFALDVNGLVNATGIRINSLDSAVGTIDCEVNSLSNVLNINAVNLSLSGAFNAPGTITTSNMQAFEIATDSLNARSNEYIDSYAPMRVLGYSTNLHSVPADTFGTSATPTRIGMRVSNNILAQSYLALSDRRIKKNIEVYTPQDALTSIMNVPVYNFEMMDPSMGAGKMAGFIAQEVEQYIPTAVKTMIGAIPSVMAPAERVREGGSLIQLANHPFVVGEYIKLLVDDLEHTAKVTAITLTTFRIEPPVADTDNVYVYGKIVPDLKMVDTDQLLPLVFNAVKDLHRSVSKHQSLLQSVLTRLSALENSMI